MRPDPGNVIKSGATVSDNIRALDRAGYKRAEIAALLGKRYQHVRNVLVDDQVRGRGSGEPTQGVAESGKSFEAPLAAVAPPKSDSLWLDVDPDGRLLLPPAFREALGVTSGGRVLAEQGKDGLWTLSSVAQALAEAQAIVRRFAKPGGSWVDELIAERRAEAERESRDE